MTGFCFDSSSIEMHVLILVLIEGVFGLLWFIGWIYYSSESPATHSSISQEERIYIENAIGVTTNSTSNKVIVIVVRNICLRCFKENKSETFTALVSS